ncbi:RluA family pseudouridine synthase [bacterium]|nr:RluA family pseudouridine synthase [bacterium]
MTWNAGQVVHITVHPDEGDVRLDRWLRRKFQHLSQPQIERLLRRGEIRVDGARAKSNARLRPGQSVRIPPLQDRPEEDRPRKSSNVGRVSAEDAEWIRSMVIHEDDRLIALNKPFGLAVQGGTGTHRHIDGFSSALVREGEEKPRLVHRLDRDTTGVLVLAKTASAAAELGKLFRSRALQKVYWAVTLGSPYPPEAQLRGWMIKAEGPGGDKEKMRSAVHGEKGAVHAVTDYAVLSNAGQLAAWVALSPQTGRTHQLRFHMAEIGCAILGDNKYTCVRPEPGGVPDGLHLHARALKLPGRNGRPLELVAELPQHFELTFEVLGFDADIADDPFRPFERGGRARK